MLECDAHQVTTNFSGGEKQSTGVLLNSLDVLEDAVSQGYISRYALVRTHLLDFYLQCSLS
eukprot:3081001-Amphidinium_carterae.1